MSLSHSYILVLNQANDELQALELLLAPLRCSIVVANSMEQAMLQVTQSSPYLVILAGGGQNWSSNLVNRLRNHANTANVTIVALTDVHAPSWQHQEDNPGLDGFLVKPLSTDVLISLVQSAWARQVLCSA